MRVPTSVLLFLVLAVLVCIISYWSDNLGKNLGKKRISLFGLRPRQTATLISMVSSVAIMLVTLLALTFLNTNFKNAIFRSDRLNAGNQKLLDENRQLENRAQKFGADVKRLQEEAKQSREAAQKAGADERKAQKETTQAQTNTSSARAQLASTRSQLTGAQSSLGAAKSALANAQNSLQAAQGNERAAQERERAAQKRLTQAQQRFNDAQQSARNAETQAREAQVQARNATTQKTEAQAQASKARSEANKARQNLRAARGNLQTARINLQNASAGLRAAAESTRKTLAANQKAAEQAADLERNIRALSLRSTQIESIANVFVGGNISITVGQVFAERILEPGQSAQEWQAQLDALQNDAFEALKKPPIDATLADLAIQRVLLDNRPENVGAEALRRILLEGLRETDVPVAVRWVAARNHAVGEKQIEGRLVPMEVRVVAPQNTELAQETIAGGQSDALVFNQLLAITDVARVESRERGVMPPLSPQEPNFFAAGTNDRVFAALRDIQARRGASRVRLVAGAPLTTVAPPQVRFVIEDAPDSDMAPESEAASTRAPSENSATPPSS